MSATAAPVPVGLHSAITGAAPAREAVEALSCELVLDDGDSLFEVIGGNRVRMEPTSIESMRLGAFLVRQLHLFDPDERLGQVHPEQFFRLPGSEDDLRPDAAFISWDRIEAGLPQDETASYAVAPNWVAKVVSPNDNANRLDHKVEDYLQAGVELVWVVYPLRRIVHVFAPGEDVKRLTVADDLDGGSVLPGFRLSIRKLFDSNKRRRPAG